MELKCEVTPRSHGAGAGGRTRAGRTLARLLQGRRHNEPAATPLLNIPTRLPRRLSGSDKHQQTQEATRALLRLLLI